MSQVVFKAFDEYTKSTTKKLKLIDSYLVSVMMVGIFQFVYCAIVGTFPFNSFLAGFISTIASFILGVCLRMQLNPQNKAEFHNIAPERAIADFIFAHILLHLVVLNFIG